MFNIQKTLSVKVGGFAGLAKTESVSTITVEKDQYFPGEEMVVKISCDNSQCYKAVKGFKVKVCRNLLAIGYNG